MEKPNEELWLDQKKSFEFLKRMCQRQHYYQVAAILISLLTLLAVIVVLWF